MSSRDQQLRQARTQQLQQSAARRAADALARAQRAIIALSSRGQAVTFATVATHAKVSESYLYKHSVLRDEIYRRRSETPPHSPPARHKSTPSAASLRTQLTVTRQRLQTLESEVCGLRRENEVLRGEVIELRRAQRRRK